MKTKHVDHIDRIYDNVLFIMQGPRHCFVKKRFTTSHSENILLDCATYSMMPSQFLRLNRYLELQNIYFTCKKVLATTVFSSERIMLGAVDILSLLSFNGSVCLALKYFLKHSWRSEWSL